MIKISQKLRWYYGRVLLEDIPQSVTYTKIHKTISGYSKLEQLHREQDGRCKYCGTQTILEKPDKGGPPCNFATLDHINPVSNGGKRRKNLVMACRLCNSTKGEMPVAEFLCKLREMVKEIKKEPADGC